MATWIYEDIENWIEDNNRELAELLDIEEWKTGKYSYQQLAVHLAKNPGIYTHEVQNQLYLNNMFDRVIRINAKLAHKRIEVVCRASDEDSPSKSFRWYLVKQKQPTSI